MQTLTLGGRGRGEARAVRGELGVVDEDVELGAAARVGAQRAVLVEVQLTRVHHFPGWAETRTRSRVKSALVFLYIVARADVLRSANIAQYRIELN